MPDVLGSWMRELCTELGLDPEVLATTAVRDLVLDLARDAAHGVARPAAPVTTFLVGYAAGARGVAALDEAAATATRLAAARAPEPE